MDQHDGQAEKAMPWTGSGHSPAASIRLKMRSFAKDRFARRVKLLGLACLVFIVYAQWTQISFTPSHQVARPSAHLSASKLHDDLRLCSKLRSKPTDPIGLGRERNARYVDGHKPTLIKNATVWVGEPVPGTSAEDARLGKGYQWTHANVLLELGLIKQVGSIDESSVSSDTLIWDAHGRLLTTGIIDMHTHAGVANLPQLEGNQEDNELSGDITPYVRSIDGIDVHDYQIQVIKSGGVTTSLVLPGSANNIGGEAFVIKHAIGKEDGRNETSATDMLADPDHNWRYIKMACGENPKRVYGELGGKGPTTRMGESWKFRHAFEQATQLVRAQDDWCDAADRFGVENMSTYLPQELEWETLGAVLRGQVHVNTHCYTVADMEAFVEHTNEFKFAVRAFHHAHQSYLIPEILKRAWGDSPPASALFANFMWYKDEAYIGSLYAGKILHENGLTPIYVSDNPVINAKHVVFEAAKAFGWGLPYHVAMASVTTAPAERLGLGQRLGKVKPGFDADIVVWDSDPMTVGATPVQVWIDGTAQYEEPFELEKPSSGPISPEVVALRTSEEPIITADVIFTGVRKSYLDNSEHLADEESLTVVISNGRISCLGPCKAELQRAATSNPKTKIVDLKNGRITKPFTGFGSNLGMNAIDQEDETDNGGSPDVFARAVDGLSLGTKKLHYAHKSGVTKAISAPRYTELGTHQGTSVGFRTDALTAVEHGAVFAEDAAVHYTLDHPAKSGSKSISNAVGTLRAKLLKAAVLVNSGFTTTATEDPFGEEAYLKGVVAGNITLVATVHSADGIASLIKLKQTVDAAIRNPADHHGGDGGGDISVAIFGGAEAHLLADELAAARIGVILAPLNSWRQAWDQRRALLGAPLSNGTAVERLVAAGVTTAVGLEQDYLVQEVGLLAGVAKVNSGGVIDEKTALELVSGNIYKILGLEEKDSKENGGEEEGMGSEFVVFEGSPLEIGSRVRAVASGTGKVSVYDEI